MARVVVQSDQRGVSLVEVCLALAITAIVLGSMAVSMQREAWGLAEITRRNGSERVASQVLDRLEQELEYAIGVTPKGFLMNDLAPGSTSGVAIDVSQGFPPFGMLLFEPGSSHEERVSYEDLQSTANRFVELGRGAQCGNKRFHAKNTLARWAASATPVADQINPLPEDFDGLAFKSRGPIFFRGDGTGFSYRLPTDAQEKGVFVADGEITWGSRVGDDPTLEGWSALYFQAVEVLHEASIGVDIDQDGDQEDIYDLGRIRRICWNAYTDDPRRTDVALCPPIVLQRRCDWGGDLNNDGFDDPLFLWEPETGRLHVSMFFLPSVHDAHARVQELTSTYFLRNGAWE